PSNVLTFTCVPTVPTTAPNWSISPTSYDYGNVPLTTSSAPFGFVVRNIGNAAGSIPGFAVSPNILPSLTVDVNLTTCSPVAVVQPGAFCLVVLSFTPQALGFVKGAVAVTGSAAFPTISGTGIAARLGPAFQLAPQALYLGDVT